MVAHGTDNLAMVWESSDKLASGNSKQLTGISAVESGLHPIPVEGVGHMQRPKHPTS